MSTLCFSICGCQQKPKTPNSKNNEFAELLFIDYIRPILLADNH
jgi:hypothetical protein